MPKRSPNYSHSHQFGTLVTIAGSVLDNWIEFEEPPRNSCQIAERTYFDTDKFACKYNLGDAVYGNYLRMGFDQCFDQNFGKVCQPLAQYVYNTMGWINLGPQPNNSDADVLTTAAP